MDDPLRYVKYSINETKLPEELDLDSSTNSHINKLLNCSIPTPYDFQKEEKIIEKYTNENRIAIEAQAAAKAKLEKDEAEAKKAETEKIAAAASARNDPAWYSEQIKKMEEQVKQNREICQFYLESMDWDVEKAVEMYKNLSM